MTTLNWEQVSAWRLRRQYLIERAPQSDLLDMISQIGVLHAQVMSAAELQAWARVHSLDRSAIADALWKDHALLKTWLWRGTLHLVTKRDFPLYVGVMNLMRHFETSAWLKYMEMTLEEGRDLFDAIGKVLNETPVTRDALAQAVMEKTNRPHLRDKLLSGWGSLLKPSAFRGELGFAENVGTRVTFVSPRAWFGEWNSIESDEAMQIFARRFLAAYAPATSIELARWIGVKPGVTSKVFKALGDEIVPVEVDGWKAKTFVLADQLKAIQEADMPFTVNLLPMFDQYTLAIAPHSRFLLDDARKPEVYRIAAWVSQVILVNGRIAGVWVHERKKDALTIQVTPFEKFNKKIITGIEKEAARLADFLGGTPAIQIGGD